MQNKSNEANPSIRCSVEDCRYHCGEVDYCSLDSIKVASHEQNPTEKTSVDCRSFECRAPCRVAATSARSG